jgi:hypothetical protein
MTKTATSGGSGEAVADSLADVISQRLMASHQDVPVHSASIGMSVRRGEPMMVGGRVGESDPSGRCVRRTEARGDGNHPRWLLI